MSSPTVKETADGGLEVTVYVPAWRVTKALKQDHWGRVAAEMAGLEANHLVQDALREEGNRK